MFPRQADAVLCARRGGAVTSPPVDLGGDDEVTPPPAVFADGFAHDDFRLAGGIAFGRVEEVDAGVVGGLHTFVGDVLGGELVDVCEDRKREKKRRGGRGEGEERLGVRRLKKLRR